MIRLLSILVVLGACTPEPKVITKVITKTIQPRSSLETALDLCIEDYSAKLPQYKKVIIEGVCKREVLDYMRNAYPKKPIPREFKI